MGDARDTQGTRRDEGTLDVPARIAGQAQAYGGRVKRKEGEGLHQHRRGQRHHQRNAAIVGHGPPSGVCTLMVGARSGWTVAARYPG